MHPLKYILNVMHKYLNPNPSKGIMCFPVKRGGLRTEDALGFLETVSIEVRKKTRLRNEHCQSYKCKEYIITSGKGWYQSEGLLESKTLGTIPAYFKIRVSVKHNNVSINFKLTCMEDIDDVEMVKSWCWLNADTYSILENSYSLLPASSLWEKMYEGNVDRVKFTNKNGELSLVSRESNFFKYDRIWKHEAHAEYVTMWIHEPKGIILKKGTIYECIWNLKYEGN